MRRPLTILTALALVAGALACKNAVPSFQLGATNGKTYTPKSFLAKPTLIVFFRPDCPMVAKALPDLNRLAKELQPEIQFVGFVKAPLTETKAFAKKLDAQFPLIADERGKVIEQFKAERSLDFTLVAGKKEARFPKIWNGCSRETIQEALKAIENHGHTLPAYDLSWFPAKRISGCSL